MSNRTYVCLECRKSKRGSASYGSGHEFRCPECSQPLTELPWRRRVPAKKDDAGWRELAKFLNDPN